MLTVPEAARRLGRNPETVRRWIRSGRLRSQRIGTQHVIDEADLASVESEQLDLPEAWKTTSSGRPSVDWERVVRDGRSAH